MFDFFYHIVSSRTRFGSSFFFPKGVLIFFTTRRHPELDSESHFYFFQKVFDFFLFYFFFISIFFIKIITTSSKGKEPARSPKPAVSCEDFFFTRWDLFWCDSGSPLPVSPRRSGAKLGRFAWGNPLLLRICLLQKLKWVALATNKSVWGIFVWRKKILVLYWNKEMPKFIWSSPRTVTKPPVSQLGRLYFFYSITF